MIFFLFRMNDSFEQARIMLGDRAGIEPVTFGSRAQRSSIHSELETAL